MIKIAIISGSIRTGRKSHNVANYLNTFINSGDEARAEIIDLKAYNFPIFEERLIHLENPSDKAKLFSEKVKLADAVIIVSPEYNGGMPASLKNAIDLLVKEWHRKPIGLVGVSVGSFGGIYAIAKLQALFLKLKAAPLVNLPVPNVEVNFDDEGNAIHKEGMDKRTTSFLKELVWVTEAFGKMK